MCSSPKVPSPPPPPPPAPVVPVKKPVVVQPAGGAIQSKKKTGISTLLIPLTGQINNPL